MLRKKSIILSTAIVLGGFLALNELEPSIAADDQPKEALTTGEVRAEFTILTSVQLAVMLRQKDFYFVNVHTPYEGEIKNTDASIIYDKIAENLDKLPRNKNEKIVLYCESGRMSEIAARELARLGYSQVSHLEGGMIAWKKSGYEVIRK